MSASPASRNDGGANTPVPLIRIPIAVRWRDMDAFGHVNNAMYLSYLEEARIRWLTTLPDVPLNERISPVVAAAQVNYRMPIKWPGDVMVELWIERAGRSSVSFGHRIVAQADDTLLHADGHVVMVWVDARDGRSVPLPDGVRRLHTENPT